ncbi:cobalamin biosynthesis protein [Paraglaciecola sp. 2405UD69-4]|uniref:cobalamin biosynthesis protein CobD/CbiB n=1 Tax=Paraglaciecola sp. 2405UD69-4 TaxID=3391836 RepID=UPI0039C9F770
MTTLIDTLASEYLLSMWVLILCVLIEKFVTWPEKYHPLSLFRLMAQRMADKVLPDKSRQTSQQKIAGILAPTTLLIPVITVIAVFILLPQYPLFFESLMLLVALKFQYVITQTKKVTSALRSGKKILARQMLSPIVLRETDKMSPLGMVKANIESIFLRFCYQYCAVIFWYLLTGGAGALIYRTLYEMSHSWNPKLYRFKYFGYPVRIVVNIMQLIPAVIGSFCIVIAGNLTSGFKAMVQRRSYKSVPMFILNTCGSTLNVSLGGPAFYDKVKIRMPLCGSIKQVTLSDNQKALSLINIASWVLMTGLILIYAIYFAALQN